MPEKDGKLSDAERQLVEEWMKKHWKSWVCPFSGDTDWELGFYVAEVRAFTGGGLNVGGPIYPYVVATCKDCGYTVLISAMKIGILPTKEDNKNADKQSSQ